MALLLDYLGNIQMYMDKYGDTRTNSWLFMSSPFPTLCICLSYVYLVKVLGPRLMENRKPFEMQNVLIVYNFLQVIFSMWLFYECLMGGWWGEYSFKCQPVDYSDSASANRIGMGGWFTGRYNFQCQPVDHDTRPETIRMVHACWWYYFSKFTEFFDTIFFVMRKKYSHVSTLHVIHHGVMPMSVWFGVKFTPGGHSTFFGLLNTFVHIIMYAYYMLSACGPSVRKYLWWKKYITTLQMIQFIGIMVHAFQLLFIDCNYPRAFVWWIGMHAVMFYFLFSDFYKQTYSKGQRKTSGVPVTANGHGSATQEKYTNGTPNGYKNGYTNGTANGKSNGHANGQANGAAFLRSRTPCAAGN